MFGKYHAEYVVGGVAVAAILIAVVFAFGWYVKSVAARPVDCVNCYELGFRLFWGQGRAITCLCIPPEKRRDVTCQ